MYGPLRRIMYSDAIARLEAFDIGLLPRDAASGCDIFTDTLSGRGRYYPLVYEGDNHVLAEPELGAILDYFGIDHTEFMARVRAAPE